MEAFLYYILRASIAAGILYLFFKPIFGKSKLHRYNRFVVLFFFVSSLILPFFSLNISSILPQMDNFKALQNIDHVVNIPLQQQIEQQQIVISWNAIIMIAYAIGVTVLLIVFGISLLRMFQIIRFSHKNSLNDNIKLCITEKPVSPFSWMNHLVLSNDDYLRKDQSIIEHEMAHIFYHHSLDMMVANIYVIVFWFNPFAWLLRKELQTIHEYQADEKVISTGIDIKEYQLLLIRKCVGEKKFMLANNFEYSNLQKRIKMMMKTNSKNQSKWVYSTIPVALLAIAMLFSWNKLQAQTTSDDSTKKSTLSFSVTKGKNTLTVTDGDKPAKYYLDGKEISNQEMQKMYPIHIKSVILNKKENKIYMSTKESIVNASTKKTAKMAVALKDENGNETTSVKVVDDNNLEAKGLEDAAVFINGKPSTMANLISLDPSNIRSVSVSKKANSELAKKYKTDKKSIIDVTTK